MNKHLIRIPNQADLPAMKAVIDANAMFPSDLLDDMIAPFFSEAITSEFWRVAESPDGELVGLAYCAPERMTEGTWNLLLIAVLPLRHNQGFGTALMGASELAVKRQNAHLMLVETSGLPEFANTREFYPRIGYKQAAVLADFYCPGDDKVVFTKRF